MMTDRVIPFANGTDYADWEDRNCSNCVKADYENSIDDMLCKIQAALAEASFSDGTVATEIAERMGANSGVCTEKDEVTR